jgi:hypothetical protein
MTCPHIQNRGKERIVPDGNQLEQLAQFGDGIFR